MSIIRMIRRFRRLNKYIPPVLFLLTDLPSVKVFEPYRIRIQSKDIHEIRPNPVNARILENVDTPLALSLYTPGRPLFRINRRSGVLIPIRSPKIGQDIEDHVTVINYSINNIDLSNYELKSIRAIDRNDLLYLPEELRSFKDKYNIRRVKAYRILGILPHPFNIQNIGDLCWHVWENGGVTIKHKYSSIDAKKSPRCMSEKSISYGRYSTLVIELGRRKYGDILVKIVEPFFIDKDFAKNFIQIYRDTSIFKYIYAIDQYTKYIRILNSNKIPGSIYRVKVFSKIDRQDSNAVINELSLIGYDIEKTNYMEIEFYEKILDDIIHKYNNINTTSKRINDLYIYHTINSAIYKNIKAILSYDLIINALIPSHSYKCQLYRLVELAFIYNDIFRTPKIIELIMDRDFNGLISLIKEYDDRYRDNKRENNVITCRYKVFDLMLNGRRTVKCKLDNGHINTIIERINNYIKGIIGNKSSTRDELIKNIAKHILIHTINHHFIKQISKRTSMNIEFISETYKLGSDRSSIFEKLSGGGDIFDTYINMIKNNPSILLEDILSMGQCLIGTPEDILFFAFAYKNKDINDAITDVINELKIIITPDEYEEVKRYLQDLLNVENLLFNLIKIYPYRNYSIIREIMKLRRKLEEDIKRFSTPEELFIYVIKELNGTKYVKAVIENIIEKYINSKSEVKKLLEGIYSKRLQRRSLSTKEIAEKFVEDIVGIINGKHTTLNDYICGKSNIGKKYRELIENTIIDFARISKAMLYKLFLKTCTGACTYCYANERICSRYSYLPLQIHHLDRRLLKLYATEFLLKMLKHTTNISPDKDFIGIIAIGEDKYYIVGED